MATFPALKPVESVARKRSPGYLLIYVMLLVCSCWHSAATAQVNQSGLHPGLQIDTALGFSETVRLGNWAPLTVTVENNGELVEGKLEVDVTSGDQLNGTVFTTTTQRNLQITTGARKRFQFTVFIDNFSVPIQVRVVSGGSVLAQQTIDLRQRFTDSRLLLVVSKNADLDYLNESSSRQLRVTYPHPDLLPNQWQGYDGAAAMVVHGVTLEQWSERQFQALRQWLGQGGTLVVSGGPDYASLRTPRLSELLPVVPGGLAVIDNGDKFREVLGDTFSAPRPFQVHQVETSGKQVTLAAGEIPLLIEGQFGAGRVVYMTFDIGAYPFNGWTGMSQLWLWKLSLPGENSTPARQATKSSAIPALFKATGLRFPDRLIVLSFVIAYFGVVAVIYRYVHLGRAEKQWITWVAPLSFLPLTWLLFVSFLSPAAIHAAAVSLITPLRDGQFARLELDIGLYSNRSGLTSLQLEQSGVVFLPGFDPDRRDQAADWIHSTVGKTRVQALDKSPYVLHTLHGSGIVDFSLQVLVFQTGSGLNVSVDNRNHQALAFGWLVFNGWLYPLGSIQGNNKTDITLSDDEAVSVHDRRAFARHLASLPENRYTDIQGIFAHTVTRVRNASPLQKNEALFIALPQNTKPVISKHRQMQSVEVSLLKSRVEVVSLLQEQTGPGAGNADAR